MQMLRMLDIDALDVPEQIPHGDMPGDGVTIGQDNIERAKTVLSAIQGTLERRLEESAGGRVVIGVCGGSGSGKTVMASVLGYALNQAGIGAYIMSGDNYPRRIPAANDAERLRLFRMGGLRGMLASGEYSDEKAVVLRELWQADADAEPETARKLPWMQTYQQAGAQAPAIWARRRKLTLTRSTTSSRASSAAKDTFRSSGWDARKPRFGMKRWISPRRA